MTEQTSPKPIGRPALTDRAALLDAARDIGFTGLTVGAVTTHVGVKYSTFYRHYPTISALVAALADEVCAQAALPEPDAPWQTYLTETCMALSDLVGHHPGLAEAMVQLPDLPPHALAIYGRLTDVLLSAGFDAERAALGAIYALETVTTTAMTTPGPGHTLTARQHQIETARQPIDRRIRAATAQLIDYPARAWTRSKIELLVHGLEASLTDRQSA